ncbi:MAG: hypothetical protein Q7R33_07465 [Nitrosarchaeum sp.]|nr:hypothetical protein [Nitrosarchaeum sp.]
MKDPTSEVITDSNVKFSNLSDETGDEPNFRDIELTDAVFAAVIKTHGDLDENITRN